MEFFGKIETTDIDASFLKQALTISALPQYCSSIDTVNLDHNDKGEIYCLWGQFDIKRDCLKHGIRFSLLNCPHALAWTVTHDQNRQEVIIHCTIDKQDEDKDFVESIGQFVSDWKEGLNAVSK